jgi:hypothetical protein
MAGLRGTGCFAFIRGHKMHTTMLMLLPSEFRRTATESDRVTLINTLAA